MLIQPVTWMTEKLAIQLELFRDKICALPSPEETIDRNSLEPIKLHVSMHCRFHRAGKSELAAPIQGLEFLRLFEQLRNKDICAEFKTLGPTLLWLTGCPHALEVAPMWGYDSSNRNDKWTYQEISTGDTLELFHEGPQGKYYVGTYRVHCTLLRDVPIPSIFTLGAKNFAAQVKLATLILP